MCPVPRPGNAADAAVGRTVVLVRHRPVDDDRLAICQRERLIVLVADRVRELDLLLCLAGTDRRIRERSVELGRVAPVRQDDLVMIIH